MWTWKVCPSVTTLRRRFACRRWAFATASTTASTGRTRAGVPLTMHWWGRVGLYRAKANMTKAKNISDTSLAKGLRGNWFPLLHNIWHEKHLDLPVPRTCSGLTKLDNPKVWRYCQNKTFWDELRKKEPCFRSKYYNNFIAISSWIFLLRCAYVIELPTNSKSEQELGMGVWGPLLNWAHWVHIVQHLGHGVFHGPL